MIRNSSQRHAQRGTDGGGDNGSNADKERKGHMNAAASELSRSWDSHPKLYQVWPMLFRLWYKVQQRSMAGAQQMTPVASRSAAAAPM
jgi:hypothetical protein